MRTNTKAKLHIRTYLCLSAILFAVLFSACSDANLVRKPEIDQSPPAFPTSKTDTSMETEIQRKSGIFADWSKLPLKSKKDLDLLHFADSLHGWIGGKTELFRTTDGGTEWQQLTLPFTATQNTRLSRITFVDPLTGWIISREQGKDYVDQTTKIYYTRDGGETWSLQYTGEGTWIIKFTCADDRECLAVGSKMVQKRPFSSGYFVLHTADGGNHWEDLSEYLSEMGKDVRSNIHDFRDGIISGPGNWKLLTLDGRLLETIDGGINWRPIYQFDFFASHIPHFIRTPDGSFNLVSGTDGKEGIGSFFLSRESEGPWIKNRLQRVYIADAAYLADNQIFACGSILPDDYDISRPDERRFGAVIYSSDNGKNWAVVYENKRVTTLNAINIPDKDHLWAAGDEGLVINLKVN